MCRIQNRTVVASASVKAAVVRVHALVRTRQGSRNVRAFTKLLIDASFAYRYSRTASYDYSTNSCVH